MSTDEGWGDADKVLFVVFKGTEPGEDQKKIPEVIELCAILAERKAKAGEELDRFHAYVKPTRTSAKLSASLVAATGVKQYMLDQASEWKTVLSELEDWMHKSILRQSRDYLLVTCGEMEFEALLYDTYRATRVEVPDSLRRYVDVERMVYHAFPSLSKSSSRHPFDVAFEETGLAKEFSAKRPRGMDEAFDLATLFRHLTLKMDTPLRIINIRD